MASQTRTAREAEDRKLSIRTLAIASIASAAAAVIVSQFWKSGTAPAAAITPVVITLISELLHKPSAAIATKITSERTSVLPEGAGAGAPAQKTPVAAGAPARDFEASKPVSEERPPPLQDDDGDSVPSDERPSREAPVSYYSSGANGKPAAEAGKRRIPWKIVAATAALAFVIGAAILTVPEIIAGESVGRTSGGTSLFGGGSDADDTKTDDSSEPRDQNQSDQPESRPDQPESQSETQKKDSSSESQKPDSQQKSTPEKTPTQPQQQQRQAPAQPKAPAQP